MFCNMITSRAPERRDLLERIDVAVRDVVGIVGLVADQMLPVNKAADYAFGQSTYELRRRDGQWPKSRRRDEFSHGTCEYTLFDLQ